MKPKNELLAVLLAGAALTVCGGAWGDGGDTRAPAASAIVTRVPAATYEATSGEALAYETLNAERSRCGFGLLAQDIRLDQAAIAHLDYLAQNNAVGHFQKPGKAGFTGVEPGDRAVAAGYDRKQVGETLSIVSSTENTEYAVRLILSAPYHALVALYGLRDVGLSWGPAAEGIRTLEMVFGLSENAVRQDAGRVLTYPCEGSAGVLAARGNEMPTPFPAEANAIWGQPILVKGASDLRVAAASITGPGGSVPIKAFYGDGQTIDPNAWCRAGLACIIPVALATDTAYIATVSGTNAGAGFRSTFRFRTGAR
ncbi:CAP domain-containing protein [Verminephrobacter aporrectodeae subsp. tuberculatae]|uniref:CAP domain-containing protein n=1 Tax=Verminephrobacter aporrectodeae TaxID=1110389 RepID=UPI002237474A|nr:CAP domain-containing protein [Verminephrobacter aporrectodeae]MCW5221984.1 CAP domain-containing protein [Verminephrobacter aporrectodeae subsp. tuberculatae]MCW5291275.1 CAP domain-containing protein [Verminephrobacter aporrectodeae subsp. tuberculatae]MCW8164302.1 CAP domain-containing protein [Verminephrobacter aporrectodeae subsp. tuberculatae]MCW8168557.1 CAP domain-containing protein [Verminephrobacter aporrectodeae subsp. tuberculatae]MCW8199369.1 CAP domain-containing protein [Verm